MEDKKIYVLSNGKELTVLENKIIEGKRYMLLYNEETEAFRVGYEEENRLVYIDDDNGEYDKILGELYSKFNNKTN